MYEYQSAGAASRCQSALLVQVVELPREKPEPALQLFAHVPNLRIVVVGGDGTVGWIMGCLDAMVHAAEAGEGSLPWAPPPLAILPLGTGGGPPFPQHSPPQQQSG